MTSNIILTGLPENIRPPKVITQIRMILKKANVKKFWLKDMADDRNTGLKSTTIELYSPEDSYAALHVLDGLEFQHNKSVFILSAYEEDRIRNSPPKSRNRESKQKRERFNRRERERERSRSPAFRDETSRLDMEIELLKKKRMIIEEERRLLMEKKKLELVKELGPSALKKLDSFEGSTKRRFRDDDIDGFRSRRRSPEPPTKMKRPLPPLKTAKKEFQEKLPNFYAPCNIIISNMREIIKKNTGNTETFELYKVLRTTLRKRLVVIMAPERRRIQANEIVAQYRQAHPKATDEALVKKLLDDIKACNLTKNIVSKKQKVADKDSQKTVVKDSDTAVKDPETAEDGPQDSGDVDNTKSGTITDNPDHVNKVSDTDAKEVKGNSTIIEETPNDETTKDLELISTSVDEDETKVSEENEQQSIVANQDENHITIAPEDTTNDTQLNEKDGEVAEENELLSTFVTQDENQATIAPEDTINDKDDDNDDWPVGTTDICDADNNDAINGSAK